MAVDYDFQRECLDYLRGTNGPLNNCKAHLYTNAWSPSPGDNLTNYTEAGYDGYLTAGVVVVWNPAVVNEAVGMAEITALVVFPVATDGTVTNTLTGIYLETAAAGSPLSSSLAMASNLPVPLNVVRAGDGANLFLTFRFDGTLIVGANF
jgi:hypothetical protein